jgi:surface polysaccharide O-acyltransferase-like enzyme
MKQKEGRLVWADVIRIIAIYFVVAAHLSYLPKLSNQSNSVYFLLFAIYKTCIPLFVMLSGALLLPKKETYSVFFKKRVNRLLAPWLAWTVVFLFVQKDYLPLVHDVPSFFSAFVATMEGFWFLPLIFSLYLLTPAIRLFVQNARTKDISYIILIWFLVISVLPYHHNSMAFPFQVDNGLLRQVLHFSGFYLLGYVLASIKIKDRNLLKIGLTCFTLGVLWVMFAVFQNQQPTSKIIFLFDYISPGVVLLSVGIFAFLLQCLRNFGENLGDTSRNILKTIGSSALGIYFIHGFIWNLLQKAFHLSSITFGYSLVSTAVLFVTCLCVIISLQQVPYLKKFVS